MNKLPFKFEEGALVSHCNIHAGLSLKVMERNHADGGNYYLCAPLKPDGTVDKEIKPFRFAEDTIQLSGAVNVGAISAAHRVTEFMEMTEKQKIEYFIHIQENQIALSNALRYISGWIQNDERVLADIKRIMDGRGQQETHAGAIEILLEVARKAQKGK